QLVADDRVEHRPIEAHLVADERSVAIEEDAAHGLEALVKDVRKAVIAARFRELADHALAGEGLATGRRQVGRAPGRRRREAVAKDVVGLFPGLPDDAAGAVRGRGGGRIEGEEDVPGEAEVLLLPGRRRDRGGN